MFFTHLGFNPEFNAQIKYSHNLVKMKEKNNLFKLEEK